MPTFGILANKAFPWGRLFIERRIDKKRAQHGIDRPLGQDLDWLQRGRAKNALPPSSLDNGVR